MSKTLWKASAPSNIALIKYMGKEKSGKNIPTNNSLSLTLGHLKSYVEIETSESSEDSWAPLAGFDQKMELSSTGKDKFISHWVFLKERLGIDGFFKIRSANDFPSDCGLASSASSFAALTLAAFEVGKDLGKNISKNTQADADNSFFSPWSFTSFLNTKEAIKIPHQAPNCSLTELALLSSQGSGSSCRSFFSPWSIWDKVEGPKAVENLGYKNFGHHVIVVDGTKKKISSSQAHQQVQTSLLFKGRVNRAEQRLTQLLKAFKNKDWHEAFQITWAEFWDMHSLFETSHPSFRYMTADTLSALIKLQDYWDKHKDGPLVTMDAGANIHLLFREDQKNNIQKEIFELFSSEFKVL